MDNPEEFNALLDESYVAITSQDRELAEAKLWSALQWVTRCINKSTKTRQLIRKTCPEGQRASWKPALVAAQCEVLHDDHARLHRQLERYAIWSDAITEIHQEESIKEAQKKALANSKGRG